MEGVGNVNYAAFLEAKTQGGADSGFAPVWSPAFLFDFQESLVDWALRKGRAAIFADCGLGKTPMELVWAENVVRKNTGGKVLLLTALAVAAQIVREADKFGVKVTRSIAAMPQRDRSAWLFDLERIRGVEATERLRKTIDEVISVAAERAR